MTQADSLYRLQEIELQILQKQKRLTEIQTLLGENVLVAEAQKQVSVAQQRLTPVQTKARNLELEIQSNTEKIKQTDESLYSGKIRNPKELQDMQQEIQSLKKRNGELEDVLLENMLLVETAEAELAERQNQLQQANTRAAQDHQDLHGEQTRLKQDVETLRHKREQAIPDVQEDSLKTYTQMKPRKNNQPVALLVDQSCSFCRVRQDMTIITEARKGQKLTLCSSCGRILAYRSG